MTDIQCEECPLCGRRPTYVGLIKIECGTIGCPNYAPPMPKDSKDKPDETKIDIFDPSLFKGFPFE